jgi:hypothetical protein
MISPARRLVQNRLTQLSDDLDALFSATRQQLQREYAESLNQAARRLRRSPDTDALCATLEDASARYAAGVMVFRLEDGLAHHQRIDVPLECAAAFRGAVESKEPQIAAASPAEVSSGLADFLGHADGERAALFPVEAAGSVRALVYAWGATQGAALELLTQMAGASWSALAAVEIPEPEPELVPVSADGLIQIAVVPAAETACEPAPAARPASTWESLPPEEQQIHLRAQRFARVQTAELRLYEAEAVQSGRLRRNLYGTLGRAIDAARNTFRERFFAVCPSMVDYLHLELVRTLANDDPDLLGKDYPGPLV